MKFELVDQWLVQLKNKISIKLAALFALIVGLLTANPVLVIGLIGLLPEGVWKYVVAFAVAFTVFAIPTLISLIKQPKMQAKIEEKADAAAKDSHADYLKR